MLLTVLLLAQVSQVRQVPQVTTTDKLSQWWIDVTQAGSRPASIALPDVVAGSPDAADSARTLTEVISADLAFAGVFRLVDKKSHPPGAVSPAGPDYYRWEAAGADLVVYSRAEAASSSLSVEVRLFGVRSKEQLFGTRYEGTSRSARALGHYIADEILFKLASHVGVSQTRIAFIGNRGGCEGKCKEVYVMDYDGHPPSQVPVTRNQSLNLSATWSPDGQALVHVSYLSGRSDLLRTFLYRGGSESLVAGPGSTRAPSWSPDGSQIAFASSRDGNDEIYVMRADGSAQRRLTRHDGIDTAPAWSPNGREIVFTSDRTGTPQIYVMDVDGLNRRQISFQGTYNDGAVWSPSRNNSEVAWASRIDKGTAFEIDVVVFNLKTNQVRQLTVGKGINESPTWSPNGEHIAFASNRTGSSQIFSMRRDGSDIRQLTRDGANTMPKWSPTPKEPKEGRRPSLGER